MAHRGRSFRHRTDREDQASPRVVLPDRAGRGGGVELQAVRGVRPPVFLPEGRGGADPRVLFRGNERNIYGEIRDGQTVIVTGSLGVFEKKGEYQIYARSAEVRGVGNLLVELERRKGCSTQRASARFPRSPGDSGS